eukprot:m.14784 g.14784  ORF g.14784 m.14784 type:complete len:61 (+) comp25980_c0_seq1:19-201(+)
MDLAISSSSVLFVWHSSQPTELISRTVEDLRSRTGNRGEVVLENVERICLGALTSSIHHC